MNDLCCDFTNLEWQCTYAPFDSNLVSNGEMPVDSFHPNNKVSSILSSSMVGTPINVDGQKIEDYFKDDIHILRYCLARIDEIAKINQFSHTPSAYCCILTFLAFIGMASCNSTGQEGEHFKDYCNNHLLRLRCKRTERKESGAKPKERVKTNPDGSPKPDVNTWGDVLYKLLRCGLVHCLSSTGNREPNQNEVEIRLTHEPIEEAETCEFMANGSPTSVLKPEWKAVTLTINAFDLCEAVKNSILHIYTEKSDADKKNMRKYFEKHPPLMGAIGK